MTNGFRIEKLRREHPVDGFTCGSADLDRFLVDRLKIGGHAATAIGGNESFAGRNFRP